MNQLSVVVTGDPRARTSGTMKLTGGLGYELIGNKWPQQRGDSPDDIKLRRMQSARNMNPDGFWEEPGIVMRGLQEVPDEWNGKVLKVISSGLAPMANRPGTPHELYDKAILCYRNPFSLTVSQQRIRGKNIDVAGKSGFEPVTLKPDPNRFIRTTGRLIAWLATQTQPVIDKFLPVDFDETFNYPDYITMQIAQHLGGDYTKEQMTAAVNTIDHRLNRSEILKEWPKGMEDAGEMAEKLYQVISDWSVDGFRVWRNMFKSYLAQQILETKRWVDDVNGTFMVANADLHRSYASNDNNVLDNTLASMGNVVAMRQWTCKHYGRTVGDKYMTEVPADIAENGHLMREHVECGRDGQNKTLEHCNVCWRFGVVVDGVKIKAQREVD